MAKAKAVGVGGVSPTDVAMNFMGFRVNLGPASNTLVSAEVPTGMSPRSSIAMLIHLIEFDWKFVLEADAQLQMALSTRAGLATMPDPNDDGVLVSARYMVGITTEGSINLMLPVQRKYLPPIALASSKLVLYARMTADVAAAQGEGVFGRIGFTTAALDAKMYQEIAETWGW